MAILTIYARLQPTAIPFGESAIEGSINSSYHPLTFTKSALSDAYSKTMPIAIEMLHSHLTFVILEYMSRAKKIFGL